MMRFKDLEENIGAKVRVVPKVRGSWSSW